jgi:hypothetical protein
MNGRLREAARAQLREELRAAIGTRVFDDAVKAGIDVRKICIETTLEFLRLKGAGQTQTTAAGIWTNIAASLEQELRRRRDEP